MTPEQKKNIKLGSSYLRPISAEDIRRRDEWIENQLPQVLDLALKQAEELERLRQLPDLVESVRQWGVDRGITGEGGKGTPIKQARKMREEMNETMDAVTDHLLAVWQYNDLDLATKFYDETKDGIGDVCVTLILLAEMKGLTLAQCLQAAYDEIKGRTGKMVGGVFVKDGGKSEPSTLGMP